MFTLLNHKQKQKSENISIVPRQIKCNIYLDELDVYIREIEKRIKDATKRNHFTRHDRKSIDVSINKETSINNQNHINNSNCLCENNDFCDEYACRTLTYYHQNNSVDWVQLASDAGLNVL